MLRRRLQSAVASPEGATPVADHERIIAAHAAWWDAQKAYRNEALSTSRDGGRRAVARLTRDADPRNVSHGVA